MRTLTIEAPKRKSKEKGVKLTVPQALYQTPEAQEWIRTKKYQRYEKRPTSPQ